ncbi:LysM peptidoglycan-binding domain-containing protein [Bacilliculturomica massiliensis]|uniref:LysM peptidoglycan-binding domain-containing protein n=1 Tax=Bacilliculturomica massiliensis TaxID=1917867 RepID=UPI001030C526|nr:LysM peptidoglycan-binding domain-containing protein [Bacilliculturomica massiliensis]
MYIFYLGGLALPVTPPRLQLSIRNRNETIDLLSGQQVNLLKLPGLSAFQFDALIPAREYPFAYYEDGFLEQDIYLSWFESLKKLDRPFSFQVMRTFPDGRGSFKQSMPVSLESYTVSESSDSGFDLNVSFELKEYVEFSTKILEVGASDADGAAVTEVKQRPAKAPARTYTVKAGDSLWAICKKQLGDGSKCYSVARSNGISDPGLIHPGQVIRFE